MSPEIVFCAYRPREGKADELLALVKQHLPTLRRLELATDRPAICCRAADGTIIEVFEWATADSARLAHEHPEVARIWEAMGEVAELPPPGEVAEMGKTFPHFAPVDLGGESG